MLALLASFVAFLACSPGGRSSPEGTPVAPTGGVLTVEAFEWGFAPARIVLQQGEQVRIDLLNEGDILHNLEVRGLDAEVIESTSSGPLEADEGQLFVGAEQGDAGTLVFVPNEAGEFTFFCNLPQHRSLGMEGTMTVEPAASP